MDAYIREHIINQLRETYIDCPECENMYSDDQYQCGTCGGAGQGGKINVLRLLTENPDLLNPQPKQ